MKTNSTKNSSYASKITAETTIWIIGILITLLVLSINTSAANLHLEEEAYIDDIPFDTEMIVSELLVPEFNFEEESYINDIPFNTSTVCAICLYEEALKVDYKMVEEEFINDIPFETEKVATELTSYSSCIDNFEEEIYISDIPFSTAQLVSEYNYTQIVNITFEFPEENYIDDIPLNTCLISKELKEDKNCEIYACTKWL